MHRSRSSRRHLDGCTAHPSPVTSKGQSDAGLGTCSCPRRRVRWRRTLRRHAVVGGRSLSFSIVIMARAGCRMTKSLSKTSRTSAGGSSAKSRGPQCCEMVKCSVPWLVMRTPKQTSLLDWADTHLHRLQYQKTRRILGRLPGLRTAVARCMFVAVASIHRPCGGPAERSRLTVGAPCVASRSRDGACSSCRGSKALEVAQANFRRTVLHVGCHA